MHEDLILILQLLQASGTSADTCREQEGTTAKLSRGRDAFLGGSRQASADKRTPKQRDPLREENPHLKRLLAEEVLINDAAEYAATSTTISREQLR